MESKKCPGPTNLNQNSGFRVKFESNMWDSGTFLTECVRCFIPRLHAQIKPPLFAQILNPHEVTPDEFVQIIYVLFAHVNAALLLK